MCNQQFSVGAHGPLLLRAAETGCWWGGGGRNNVVRNQTPSSANMTSLNSLCTVQCADAIKLWLVFLKQFEMYHTSVVLSFIAYAWGRISGSIDGLLFFFICFEHIACQCLGGGWVYKKPGKKGTPSPFSHLFLYEWLIYLFLFHTTEMVYGIMFKSKTVTESINHYNMFPDKRKWNVPLYTKQQYRFLMKSRNCFSLLSAEK